MMGRQVGGRENIGHTLVDQNNHLRDVRKETLIHGEAISILRYFCEQATDNPSFQHAVQVDDKNEISNIFWADAQMIIDYAQFGNVVIFYTTHGTNKECRPFGVFVGLNHFRETVIFGAILLYDQTIKSFEWVFTTFLEAHNNKKPVTIFTDQDAVIGIAIANVFSNTRHGLCTWHISENAARHLSCHNKDGINYVSKFSQCVYEYEDEEEFENAFRELERKLGGTWLPFVYKERKKWAHCYMKDAFSLGIRSTQLCESLNKDLKNYLKSNLDIVRFFKHFERVVTDKREKETISEYDYRRKVPRCKMNIPILLELSKLYTPKNFELFQLEYELSVASQIEHLGENEYKVTIFGVGTVQSKCCTVTWNPSDKKISCSCKKFERWGILCCHGLKVLDTMNFKLLPKKYVLERWTHASRNHIVCDKKNGITVVDTKLDLVRRNRDLCRKFTRIAAKACTSEETSFFLDSILDKVDKEIDEKLLDNSKLANSNYNTNATPDFMKNIAENQPHLKKKNIKMRGKRHTSWVEDLPQKNKQKTRKQQPATHNSTKNELSSAIDKELEISDANCNSTREVRCAEKIEICQQSGLKSFTDMLMGVQCEVWSAPFDLLDDDVNLVRE